MKLQDLGLLAVRLLAGGMMLTHGIPKIDRLFGEGTVKFADPPAPNYHARGGLLHPWR